MSLSDYSTEELREELRRRTNSKVQYAYAFGKVVNDNRKRPLGFRKCYVEFSDEQVRVHKLPDKKWHVPLLGGYFKADNAPRNGDRVKLRSRITKTRPKFNLSYSKICEVVKQ